MKIQEEILEKSLIINDSIIKIDNIVNHKIDVSVLKKVAEHICSRLDNKREITKIVTVETGGIPVALFISMLLGDIDVVYAKKGSSKILSGDLYTSKITSFTKGIEYDMLVDKNYLTSDDNILIVDDFLASGEALNGLISIANQADANISSIAVIINKIFQNKKINSDVEIIACIDVESIENGIVNYRD